MKSYLIGREGDCNIVLNDPTDVTSRHHALLTVSSSGKMTITDQGSSNGTYINGIMITPNVPVPVTRKDVVSFAHVITLDWNLIPKSGIWWRYLIGGLAVAAVIAAGVIYIPKLINREKEPVIEVPQGSFAVTFMSNGGSGEMEAQVVKEGEETALNENKYTRDDYKFIGWKDDAGKSYDDKAMVTLSTNLKLYAQWEKTVAVITFDKNGGGGKMEPQKVKVGTDTILNANAFSNSGHVFVGWSTVRNPQKSESSTAYADKAVVNFSEDITLYAQWKTVDVSCTISFNANGGNGTMSAITVKKGESVTLPANSFTRDGYEFVGWKTAPSSGTSYANKASLKPSGNMQLYAQWKSTLTDRF